jgi:fused signal recognition particle receptor
MGPGIALLILLVVLGVLAVATTGIALSRRRAREVVELPPLAPEPEEEPPLAIPDEVQTPSVVVEERAPEVEAPAAEAPVVEAPPEEAKPPVAEAPVVDAPPVSEAPVVDVPVVEERPAAEPVVAEPAKRKRIRGIGASISRLFKGSALSDEEWEQLEEMLLRADVGVAATAEIVAALRARKDVTDGVGALRAELLRLLGTEARTLARTSDGLTVWLVTGVNGVGKTTTIGKLAAQLRGEGVDVVLAAADTFRAAADEQLQRWAEIAGARIVRQSPGADPAAVVFDGVKEARASKAGALIVDTAGRLQTKKNLMDELSKIRRVLEREAGAPDEVLLVLDATTGQNGLQQARAFADAAQITGLVLTKLDGTAKGGIVVAVQRELGIPVKLVGMGEGVEDLAAFDPAQFVDDLLAAD